MKNKGLSQNDFKIILRQLIYEKLRAGFIIKIPSITIKIPEYLNNFSLKELLILEEK